jgi:N6-L-threonylcarbamoyladenine synthase
VLAAQLASSLKRHQKYGGVIPEIASRAHVELLTCELEVLLTAAKVDGSQIDRIAVTHGPGLAGALLVGVAAAKALGLAWRKALVPVNHLHAHLYAALMAPPPPPAPSAPRSEGAREQSSLGGGGGVEDPEPLLRERMIGLVISGGHTALVRMDGIGRYTLLGQTRDDAVGEAFDKVAKLLGLKFPGGPEIERVARDGNPAAFRFTVPKMKSGSPYEFSLSGMNTAVLYKINEWPNGRMSESARKPGTRPVAHSLTRSLDPQFVADMAASVQSAIVEEAVQKTVRACRDSGIVHLVVGGGVVANGTLRRRMEEVCAEMAIRVRVPPMALCTDNGAMVAGLGAHLKPVASRELTALPELGVS